jgi:adenylylsulfate kinase-like enzyme
MAERGHLVVITGPVASGKNTTAHGLAALARARGFLAASIDLDELVFMINGPDWLSTTSQHWQRARRLAARMVQTLLDDGAHMVVLAGPFFTQESRDDLLAQLHGAGTPTYVMLHVSLEESYRRIESDLTRVFTKDREFTRGRYESIEWDKQPNTDIVVETDGMTPSQVLEKVSLSLVAAVAP